MRQTVKRFLSTAWRGGHHESIVSTTPLPTWTPRSRNPPYRMRPGFASMYRAHSATSPCRLAWGPGSAVTAKARVSLSRALSAPERRRNRGPVRRGDRALAHGPALPPIPGNAAACPNTPSYRHLPGSRRARPLQTPGYAGRNVREPRPLFPHD